MTPGVKDPASIKRRSASRTSRQVTSLRQWLQGVLGGGMAVLRYQNEGGRDGQGQSHLKAPRNARAHTCVPL